jgi:hypothetical protein
MSDIGKFQKSVNNLIGSDAKFQIDRAHAGKLEYVDLTQRLPNIGGADKVEVDYNGNVIGGSTQIGNSKLNW